MNLKLCESDYKFMSIIWENEPIRSGKLVELCASRLNWKKSTTYTTLKKVCDKGLAQNENTESFSGSLPNFLASFFAGKKISDKEANELKKVIDDFKE